MRRILTAASLTLMVLLTAATVRAQSVVGTSRTASVRAPHSGQTVPPSNWTGLYVGVHAGWGSGSLLDVANETCDEFDDFFELECSGDDRGPVWALGMDARWQFNRLLDFGGRVEYSKPADITLSANGDFEGIPFNSAIRADGSLLNISAQVGISPATRFRIYSGYGASRFDFDVTQSVTAFDQSETESENTSGWGHHFYAGAEYFLHRRVSLFGEGGRSWLKDESEDLDLEDFDEKYSRWMVGVRFELARPRWR